MLALLCGEVTVCVMRSKLKILALMGVTGAAVISVSCEDDKKLELPPVESTLGKVESAKAKLEREAKEAEEKKRMEQEKMRVELQEAVQNLDSYSKEGLEKNTEMDPFIKDALLMAMDQKEARKKKKEAEKAELMAREKEAGVFLDVIEKEKKNLAAADAEYAKIAEQQHAREEKERLEKNAKGVAPEGMVWVPGGKFLRGSRDMKAGHRQQYGEEFPAHLVEVDGFYMDATEVTNAEFAEFVKATGYKTLAEVGLKQEDFPQARPEDLQGGANVFKKTDGKIDPWVGSAWRWWNFTPGATWKSPEGPGSDIKDKMDHPVTCVNYNDAVAYAKWAGKRLPTEAEWERAARAGKYGKKYNWGNGDEMQVDGKWMANVYQGEFPSSLKDEDGYRLTSPAKSYPANAWGLYDMAGNVWEICNDYFNPGYYYTFVKNPHKNPKGPETPITDQERMAFNPVAGTCPEPRGDSHVLTHLRVAKGGSFLCSSQYCLRFRPAARHHHEVLTPSQHTGFRCVKDVE
jgi:formylglycine-generating enzyme required for sulfatase activity